MLGIAKCCGKDLPYLKKVEDEVSQKPLKVRT